MWKVIISFLVLVISLPYSAFGTQQTSSDQGTAPVPETPQNQTNDTQPKKQNADRAHENENSLANRMLGGASMAAMGIGGMELARGIAEQNADADADTDMTAYLATFKCEYGSNRVNGGTTGNEIPGANQLFNLYQEYAALASSVKATKEALNMTPGIESQVILNNATVGLYDDVSDGKTNGTFASLYRAKMGSDIDQAKLQEMSDTSKNRIVGGAVAAGAGAIAGIAGNILLNQNDKTTNNENQESTKTKKDKTKQKDKKTPSSSQTQKGDQSAPFQSNNDQQNAVTVTPKQSNTDQYLQFGDDTYSVNTVGYEAIPWSFIKKHNSTNNILTLGQYDNFIDACKKTASDGKDRLYFEYSKSDSFLTCWPKDEEQDNKIKELSTPQGSSPIERNTSDTQNAVLYRIKIDKNVDNNYDFYNAIYKTYMAFEVYQPNALDKPVNNVYTDATQALNKIIQLKNGTELSNYDIEWCDKNEEDNNYIYKGGDKMNPCGIIIKSKTST